MSLPFVVGVCILALTWELVGRLELAGRGWPPLSEVASLLLDPDASATIRRSIPITGFAALKGLLIGAGVGVALALAGVVFRLLRNGIERATTSLQAIPIIAFAPILITTLGRDKAPMYSAAIIAVYPMWVRFGSSLLHAPQVYAHVSIATGSSRSKALRWVFVPHATPALIDGLRLAAPAAVIGAIIGEWFGSERGLGVVILASLLNNQIVQLWAAALGGALLSLVAYGVLTKAHQLNLARGVE